MSMGSQNWFTRWIPIRARFQLNDDDIVVFVVGPTGSGKTTFVHAVTQALGLGLEIGKGLGVTTKKVQPIRCELTDEARIAVGAEERKYIVFIDTPSFHIDDKTHKKAVTKTTSWLKKLRSESTRFGTIYLHRIETDPGGEDQYRVQKQLHTFAGTFPQDLTAHAFPHRLRCVFSRFDEPKGEKIADHQAKFQDQLNDLRPAIVHGSKLRWDASIHPNPFKGDPNTAWHAVERLFSSPPGP